MRPSLVVLLLLTLAACGKQEEKPATVEIVQDKGPALASVDGEKIYLVDLDDALIDMFGEYQASLLDEQGRRKALESLVASRALAKMANKTLDNAEQVRIDSKARRYKENLAINAYVREQITAQPVSAEMVKDYYDKHLEHFGQKTLREYELLSTDAPLRGADRDRFLEVFGKLPQDNINIIRQQLSKKGFAVKQHKGVTGDLALQPKLRDFIQAQTLNKLSGLMFIDGKPHLVLVTGETVQPARPLAEVQADIRKSLAVQKLKAEIKMLSAKALEQSQVTYY